MLETTWSNILATMAIFKMFRDAFGLASGLPCQWIGNKVTLLSFSPFHVYPSSLDWRWKSCPTSFKLLNFYFSNGLDRDLTIEHLSKTFKENLNKAKKKKTFYIAWATIISHLILGTLWFMFIIWIGDPTHLKAFESILIKFLLVGQYNFSRNSVNAYTITLAKIFRGLGLLSWCNKVRALGKKLILWALGKGDHPLKKIYAPRFVNSHTKSGGLKF